jgi:Icc-related predicted phosphoesterase
MIIDCISDLHGSFPKLEGGDLLIIAGDLTARHTEKEFEYFWTWASYQSYDAVIVTGGNHDDYLEKNPHFFKRADKKIFYLCDSGTEFQGFKIWGSPWTKAFEDMNPKCRAFTKETDIELFQKWDIIPKDTDILITHSPPFSILDKVNQVQSNPYGDKRIKEENVGSISLRNRVNSLCPKLHVFGHIHQGYGIIHLPKTTFVNASIMNEDCDPINKPIRVFL